MNMTYLIIFFVFIYSAYVFWLLLPRDEYSKNQKVFQCVFMILLPLIGAFIVHGMIRDFDRKHKIKNPNDGLAKDGFHDHG